MPNRVEGSRHVKDHHRWLVKHHEGIEKVRGCSFGRVLRPVGMLMVRELIRNAALNATQDDCIGDFG